MRDFDEGVGGSNGDYGIFAKATGIIEPTESVIEPPSAKGVFFTREA